MVNFFVIIHEYFSGWQAAQCQLFVDPLSRGHRAFVYTHEEPFLEYNGQRMDFAEGFWDQCVRDFDFYADVSFISCLFLYACPKQPYWAISISISAVTVI